MMRKSFILLIAAFLLCSCNTIHYLNDGSGACYIKTAKGKVWGIGWLDQCYIYPEFESVSRHWDTGGWVVFKEGYFYFYDVNVQLMCNGEALLTNLREHDAYWGAGCLDELYKTKSQSGTYMIYDSNTLPSSQTPVYGPFKDFITGHTGYMFKDVQTGRWGVGKYGDWENTGYTGITAPKHRFIPCDSVIIAPKYDKIVNIAYERRDAWPKGYLKESDIKWYCQDENGWVGFDMEGKPISVDKNLLNRALKIKVKPIRESITEEEWRSFSKVFYRRVGKEEASVYIIDLVSW